MKVYITAPGGVFIFGIGQREYGEVVEVEPAIAEELLGRPGFSTDDPNAAKKRGSTSRKEELTHVGSE